MAITVEVLNELLKDYEKPEDLLGQNGLLKQLQKRLLEKAMGAELTVHLGYGKHDPAGRNSGNSRNGTSPKTLKGEFGNLELATPRDRNGSFEPQIVAKGQRRFEGFDQAIISLYSRGLTTREIEGHLLEIYGVEVSPALVSQVTDAASADVQVWQNRPLEEVYPIVYFDALWGKVRDNVPRGQGGGVSGAGDHDSWAQGGAGDVGGQLGRGQVLAAGVDRVEESRGARHLHWLRGWAERLSRSDGGGLSGDPGAISPEDSPVGTWSHEIPMFWGVKRNEVEVRRFALNCASHRVRAGNVTLVERKCLSPGAFFSASDGMRSHLIWSLLLSALSGGAEEV
jgi:hypothetical protein